MGRLPLAPFEKMLKDSEKRIRVSKEATVAFAEFVEEFSRDMSRDIAELARHARRKTILADDVKIAVKRFRKG
ncbi:MAG: NFYB/HAP3 family transcription factor subunit [Candidatus Aenigmarchaeota archaeon]|nr:NFYB/HAP3 family transcription factor subunit [Candidatus Aenigmarchaeota archaeon]